VVGAVPVITPEPSGPFDVILAWADEFRRLRVRTNADLPHDAQVARRFGAEGIGLCRTEHMFLGDRLPLIQRFILAEDEAAERDALTELERLQRADFIGILEAMDGLPVTVRLLDPPLHEFLPNVEELLVREAKGELDAEGERLLQAAQHWREANPMLGTRGCRLGLLYPEIYEMQVRAIVRAALAVEARSNEVPLVEIMHPLVGFAEELRRLRRLTLDTASAELEQASKRLEYHIGTMIELPRACVRADEIAREADFFSFGTNDLTQTTLGFSRDDAEGKFLTRYLEERILDSNPFETLDVSGVGDLMRIAVERARGVDPEIKLGICGEHGGDPKSVAFCHELGLAYVSCSPFRVPLARLAAAQAALAERGVTSVQVGG
jgi:pyruvate,orthophosphate dikinase